jgi:CheY-like chemotaxis protein
VFRQHRNEIRCVLSDLAMPRMDGWETLAVLRKPYRLLELRNTILRMLADQGKCI